MRPNRGKSVAGSSANRGKRKEVESEFDDRYQSEDEPELELRDETSSEDEEETECPKSPKFRWLEGPLPVIPKLKAARKNPIKDITDPKGIEPANFCTRRFVCHDAHMFFLTDRGLKYKVNPEKEFDFTVPDVPKEIKDAAKRENFQGMYALVKDFSCTALTREMTANARYSNCACHYSEVKDERMIYVRGKFVVFTPATINEAFEWPPLTKSCKFHEVLRREGIEKELGQFCFGGVRGAEWERRENKRQWKIENQFLLKPGRWLIEWVETWILGITSTRTVDFDTCVMAYCLFRGWRFDIPAGIHKNFRSRLEKGNRRAPGYSYLLMHLATKAGVTLTNLDRDRQKPPERLWNNIPTPFRNLPPSGSRRRGRAAVGGDESGPSEPASSFDVERAFARMMAKEDRHFEHTRSSLRKIGAEQTRQGRLLAQMGSQQNFGFDPQPGLYEYASDPYQSLEDE